MLLNSLYDIDFTQKDPIASQMFDRQQNVTKQKLKTSCPG